jgi:GNAT superfamily N-acetyltransferase
MIEFRKATIDDINELVGLRVEFLNEIRSDKIEASEQELKDLLYNYFTDTIPKNEFIAWLALDRGKIIATSGLCFYTMPPSNKNLSGKIAYIMNMYTTHSYRKQGIASNLFNKTVEEAEALGYKNISLHATEEGRPLYLKFGFKESDSEMTLIKGSV